MAEKEVLITALLTTTRKRKLHWKQASQGKYVSHAGHAQFALSRTEDKQPVLTIMAQHDTQEFLGSDISELFDSVRAQVISRDAGILEALSGL